YDEQLWRALTELGLHGLLVPEQFGGAGLGILDAAVAAEALGNTAAPVPFTGPLVMATLALLHSAAGALQEEYLPLIAGGEVRFAVGFAGQSGQTGTATASLQDGRLSGRVGAVMDAGAATHALIYLADGHAAVA